MAGPPGFEAGISGLGAETCIKILNSA